MERSRAAERDERQAAGVDAARDGHRAHGFAHRGVDDRDDPRGRGVRPLEGDAGGADVEGAEVGERGGGVDAPEREVGVGDGGVGAAAGVAGGAGLGPRAAGTDGERAPGVDRGDRATPGADGVDVEGREPDGVSGDVAGRRGLGDAAPHEAHVGAGAAHVERHRVGIAARRGDGRGRPDAARRTGQQQGRGEVRGGVDGDEPAGGGHDQDLVGEPREAAQVVPTGGAEQGVGDGGDGPLVLAELR